MFERAAWGCKFCCGCAQDLEAIIGGGLRFSDPKAAPVAKSKRATRERVPRPKAKNDPKLVAAARELRDR